MLALALVLGGQATANTEDKLAATHGDWQIWIGNQPRKVWVKAAPWKSIAVQGGQKVQLPNRRPRFFVTFEPDRPGKGRISCFTDHHFREDLELSVEIALKSGVGKKHVLLGGDKWALPFSDEEDDALLATLLQGASFVVHFQTHGENPITIGDAYLLRGFADAMREAEKLARQGTP